MWHMSRLRFFRSRRCLCFIGVVVICQLVYSYCFLSPNSVIAYTNGECVHQYMYVDGVYSKTSLWLDFIIICLVLFVQCSQCCRLQTTIGLICPQILSLGNWLLNITSLLGIMEIHTFSEGALTMILWCLGSIG